MRMGLGRAFACAVGLAATGAVAAEPASLSGDDLRRTVAGRTIVLDTPVGGIPIVYQADGGMVGKAHGMPAHLMQGPRVDHGRWWVSAGSVCQQWKAWLDGRKHCYRMRIEGRKVHWRREDGHAGTARIVSN